ncbi:MAG: DUF3467 domain-containing protein [Bacteroidales bacterium]|nr:DUF3467 domain-containing protein [Paludibacteraceae bacterium]MBP5758699.1 DUF3467 domain-containing protein [Bacteroidales bacterium]
MKEEEKKPSLNIELPAEVAEGTYANLAIISHSPSEFVLDFVRVMPGAPKAKVKSRVVMNAEQTKRLLKALADNVQHYEEQFGTIKLAEQKLKFPAGFPGMQGEA